MLRLFKRNAKVLIWGPAKKLPSVTSGKLSSTKRFEDNAPVEKFPRGSQSNGIEITDLRIQFNVKKSVKKEPNTCEITITNLAPETRGYFELPNRTIELQAGYDGEFNRIFTGNVRWCRSEHNGTDYETKVELGDGDRAYRLARVNRSFRAYTPVLAAVKYVAGQMNMSIPSFVESDPDMQRPFASGVALHGYARDALSTLLAPFGYGWTILNNELQILKDSDVINKGAWEIAGPPDGALIGSPAFGPPTAHKALKSGKVRKSKPSTMTLTTLLQPHIDPGGVVALRSENVTGQFRVQEVKHAGDTHGGDWKTEIETVNL